MVYLVEKEGKISFKVKVQPRASKNQLAGVLGDMMKLRITAPPVDGEANKEVIAFFADFFKVPKSKVVITSGLTSRTKIIGITGVTKKRVEEKLMASIK